MTARMRSDMRRHSMRIARRFKAILRPMAIGNVRHQLAAAIVLLVGGAATGGDTGAAGAAQDGGAGGATGGAGDGGQGGEGGGAPDWFANVSDKMGDGETASNRDWLGSLGIKDLDGLVKVARDNQRAVRESGRVKVPRRTR